MKTKSQNIRMHEIYISIKTIKNSKKQKDHLKMMIPDDPFKIICEDSFPVRTQLSSTVNDDYQPLICHGFCKVKALERERERERERGKGMRTERERERERDRDLADSY
ncbi:hypothetical protein HYC85_030277 [Camellia sinensis]|uniref:Uncharacterized protein n=1 Tax=Camellia sinensis TaxID=4442 RepID=A0A7J7G4A2_CAMSI|nr:hypothetical protein HYC85_030277 [Camellia sinensis]